MSDLRPTEEPFPPALFRIGRRRGRLLRRGQDHGFAQRAGRDLIEQQYDPGRVFSELRSDAFGGLPPLIDEVVVGAIAFELVVKRRGVEPLKSVGTYLVKIELPAAEVLRLRGAALKVPP